MLVMLLSAIALIAVVAWCVAVVSALRVIALVPAGQRLSAWFSLGWWQFAKIRASAGDAAIPHIKRYIQAFVAFFAAVVSAILIAILAGISAQDDTSPDNQAAEPKRIDDPRIVAVRTAERMLLPAYPPISSSLESL